MFHDLKQLQLDASKDTDKTTLLRDLKKIASDKGYIISDNQGSGDCMFYALSEQLELVKGIKISHEELRRILVHYLKENPKLVSDSVIYFTDTKSHAFGVRFVLSISVLLFA